MNPLEVLIIDDEPAIRQVLAAYLQKAGHRVRHVGEGLSAVKELSTGEFDICICDIRLPDIDGIEILRRSREAGVTSSFLMITAFASVDTAIQTMKLGAYDYLIKPLRNEDVLRRIEQIGDLMGLKAENRRLRKMVVNEGSLGFDSQSPAMRKVEQLAAKVARTSGTVLITGESGTGKTYIARRIHDASTRSDRAFVSVNCGAIPENLLESEFFGHTKGAFTGADRAKKGLFREADGGTLFLDEIAELPLALQVKLLHVIEDKEVRAVGSEETRKVDVRIIAATNKLIEKLAAEGSFREDLFYRLNMFQIHLPPLRERREDLPSLIDFFIQREAKRLGMDPDFSVDPVVEDILISLEWGGNMRELQNVIARAMILAEDGRISVADLPPQVAQSLEADQMAISRLAAQGALRDKVRLYEIKVIRDTVAAHDGDRQAAALELGIGLSTLYRKLDEVGKLASR